MKTTEHGIEDSKDIENMHHMRLMTLLQELVRDKGYKGAARVLELDQRTVAECARTGQLSRRVRQALERALQEGVGSAAARQRERNDRLEKRVVALEKGRDEMAKSYDTLGKEVRRRVAAVEGRVEALKRSDAQGTGAGHAGAGPSQVKADGSERGASGMGRKPPPRPRLRREYPDLVTLEPAEDDEEVFGEVWPMIVEWRELKDAHPNDGKSLGWLRTEERFLALELALLEDHGMTLPPARFPAEGLRPQRAGQLAPDGALRHAESAQKAGASEQADPPTAVAVAGPGVRRLAGNFSERFGGGLRKGCRRPSFAGLGPLIMSVLLGFFQGFRP